MLGTIVIIVLLVLVPTILASATEAGCDALEAICKSPWKAALALLVIAGFVAIWTVPGAGVVGARVMWSVVWFNVSVTLPILVTDSD